MSPTNSGTAGSKTREHLLELLGPIVVSAGCELEDVTVTRAGRRSIVRVIVDADGGIDLDAIARVSRAVSAALDDDAPGGGGAAFAGPYVLEVTSPGVDRPLTEQRHWRRAIGRLVQTEIAGQPTTARVIASSASGMRLEIDGTAREVPWAELGRGRVEVEFNRAGAPEITESAPADNQEA